jgi:hypothetical protein
LRNRKHLPTHFRERAIHFARVVLENPQFDDSPGEEFGILLRILLLNPKQDEDPGIDPRVFLALDDHSGARHTLDDRSHGNFPEFYLALCRARRNSCWTLRSI